MNKYITPSNRLATFTAIKCGIDLGNLTQSTTTLSGYIKFVAEWKQMHQLFVEASRLFRKQQIQSVGAPADSDRAQIRDILRQMYQMRALMKENLKAGAFVDDREKIVDKVLEAA